MKENPIRLKAVNLRIQHEVHQIRLPSGKERTCLALEADCLDTDNEPRTLVLLAPLEALLELGEAATMLASQPDNQIHREH